MLWDPCGTTYPPVRADTSEFKDLARKTKSSFAAVGPCGTSYRHVRALRRVLGVAGTVLLGGALAWAPVAAFTGEMLPVTKAGLAGVALLILMKLLPRRDATPEHQPDLDDER